MGTDIRLPLLDSVRIASPCAARWEDMAGDDRRRRCAQCDLDVHNISALTRDEAETVLSRAVEGRVCARLYRRADGTVLTRDCPRGLAAVRRRARLALVRVGALIGLTCGAGVLASQTASSARGDRLRLRAQQPFERLCELIDPSPAPAISGRLIMGDVMVAPRPAARGGSGR